MTLVTLARAASPQSLGVQLLADIRAMAENGVKWRSIECRTNTTKSSSNCSRLAPIDRPAWSHRYFYLFSQLSPLLTSVVVWEHDLALSTVRRGMGPNGHAADTAG
jgi:hypothetical protein